MTTQIHAVEGGLRIALDVHDDLVLASLSGPLDIYTAPGFRDDLEPHSVAGDQIVIDLSEVSLIDSSGLGALVRLRTQAVRDGPGQIGLICPHRRLRRVFVITGLRAAFVLEADLSAVRLALTQTTDL